MEAWVLWALRAGQMQAGVERAVLWVLRTVGPAGPQQVWGARNAESQEVTEEMKRREIKDKKAERVFMRWTPGHRGSRTLLTLRSKY